MRVLWSGPPAPWADSLGSVHATEDVREADADLVVLADGVGGRKDWLRRPRTRPAVVAVAETEDEEDEALRAGAEGVVARDATPAEVARVARRAVARHAGVRADAELFRVMVESATDLLTLTDADGRTLYANPAADVHLGRSPTDVVTSGPLSSVHPEDRADVLRSLADAFATGAAAVLQYRVLTPEGAVRVVESRGRAVPGPDGEHVGVVATRDVTDQTEMERRLTESRARYRTVVQALPDVVSRLSPDGLVLDFHVPEVFATEFPAERLVGRRLQDVIPADLAGLFLKATQQLSATGETVAYGYEVEIAGRTHHREVRMAPIEGGEVLSILRDVTRLRENETALERSRAELRALATHLQDVREEERSRLSREVHDVLGQQLTAIRLGIGWFGRHYADDAAAQARLGDVRETIDDTIRHVRQIAADLRPGVLDDFGLASAAAWQAKRFEERTGTPCAVDVHGVTEPPPGVATAAFRVLQEALTNVARHAHAESVAVTLVLGPESVRLVVADDGRGFDAEHAGRRSLGLIGMRERAGAQGGTLEVRGVPSRGTVVECTLPHSSPADPPADRP
ncbi:PAS domain-containing sensor histidine kinase [Rubrivirga sp.]|uniref:PAS domain-containing sensor histidine kinase n=1 Tax=Rubrivirga sp. TaxID=1885344 RepID=UPI003B52F327